MGDHTTVRFINISNDSIGITYICNSMLTVVRSKTLQHTFRSSFNSYSVPSNLYSRNIPSYMVNSIHPIEFTHGFLELTPELRSQLYHHLRCEDGGLKLDKLRRQMETLKPQR